MDRFYVYGQGPHDIAGLGGRHQVTRVTRRVFLSDDSPNDLLPRRRVFQSEDSPNDLLSRLEPFRNLFRDDFSPMPPSFRPPMITRRFYQDSDDSTPFPPKPQQPMIPQHNYYRDEPSTYPPRHGLPGGNNPIPGGNNPINLHVNLHMRPPEELYPGNGNYNVQKGGGEYNPQVQGGNKLNGDGKISMGPEINGGNVNIGGGNAGGGNVGGKKKKKKKKKDEDSDSEDDDDDGAKAPK